MGTKPTTIDEYLATVSPERRAALEQLRRTIHAVLPGVEECISYSMPAFRHEGHVVAGFLATKTGCSYYPFSGTTLATLAGELVGFEQTKSALHFTAERPLTKTLVRKLLTTRRAEVASSRAPRPAKTKPKPKLQRATPKPKAKTKSRRGPE